MQKSRETRIIMTGYSYHCCQACEWKGAFNVMKMKCLIEDIHEKNAYFLIRGCRMG